jgi:hypothetical protein
MSALDQALALQQRSLADLREVRGSTVAWSDAQREKLDRHALDPLASDGQRLLDALRRAAQEITSAETQLG